MPRPTPRAATPERELLREIYRRIVGWHHTIASADEVTIAMQRRLLDSMMATLERIEQDPRFGATEGTGALDAEPDDPSGGREAP